MGARQYDYLGYRILQFAKAPVLGQVKTRMGSRLSPEQCLGLHRALTRRVFSQVYDSNIAPQRLWVGSEPAHLFFQDLTAQCDVPVLPQEGGDLGERMAHAVEQTFNGEVDVKGVVLIGSDCPFIDRSFLSQAIATLEQGSDAVIGPAEDGGYVLLGLSRMDHRLFRGIDWGAEVVADQTRKRLQQLQWSYSELSVQADIDRPEDLTLLQDLKGDPVLQAFARLGSFA